MQVQVLALDRRFGFAGAAAVLMQVQVQVLALDRRFGFAGATAVLMQVQVLALDRRFFAGAVAVLMLVPVQVQCLDRRFGRAPSPLRVPVLRRPQPLYLLRRARRAPRCLAGRGGRAGGPFDARPLRRGPARRPPPGPLCAAARGTRLRLLGRCVRYYLRPRSGRRRVRRTPGRLTRPRQRACALGQNPGLERRR